MITDERLRWISGPDYIASEPGQIAAELLTARARIRELEASLASYQAARVHDVDEKGGLSKRVSELEAALELQKDILAKYHKLNCSTAETKVDQSTKGE